MIKTIIPACFSLVALLFSPSANATGILSDDTFVLAGVVSLGKASGSATVSGVNETPTSARGVNTSKTIIDGPDPNCAVSSHCLTCQSGVRYAECIKCPMGRQLTSDLRCIVCPLGCRVRDKTCENDLDGSSCP